MSIQNGGCWNCNRAYSDELGSCPYCMATNPNVDLEQANKEALCDHDWKFQDESFDHEFGTEQVHFFVCNKCDMQRPMESTDYSDDSEYDYLEKP